MGMPTPGKLLKEARRKHTTPEKLANQMIEKYGIAGAAERLGVARGTLYHWLEKQKLMVVAETTTVWRLVPKGNDE